MKRFRQLKRAVSALQKKYKQLEFSVFGGLLLIKAKVSWDDCVLFKGKNGLEWDFEFDYTLVEDNSEGLFDVLTDGRADGISSYLNDCPEVTKFNQDFAKEVRALIQSPEDVEIIYHLGEDGTEEGWIKYGNSEKNREAERRQFYEELRKEFDEKE